MNILFGITWEFFSTGWRVPGNASPSDSPRQTNARPARQGISWSRLRAIAWLSAPSDRGSASMAPRLATLALAFAFAAAGLAAPRPATAAPAYNPATDMNSMYNTTLYSGARSWWAAGYTGAGVDIALIDTGVSPVAGLSGSNKLIHGPDLSLESQNSSFRNLDTNGHGTFMAGLMAGRDGAVVGGYAVAPPSTFLGMAPDARILSLKVATADGGTDVSQVIAAINWVIQHKNDNGMNVRVLNLSYGTDSTQGYQVDPLAFAVEQAWNAGIFVVAATGNEGYVSRAGSLTNPAYDPNIFAVGASDPLDTSALSDDIVADFSSTGSNDRYVDMVAPGSHMVSLRVPGSYIDLQYGGTGYVTDRYFRGSGTSAAAAITSGAAALAFQRYPDMDPTTLKYLFRSSARTLGCNTCSQSRQGQGELDLARMLTTMPFTKRGKSPAASTGTGSLELARGSDHLTRDGVVLTGERDIFSKAFNSAAMASLSAAGNSWSGGWWNGSQWSGNSWSGNSWSGNSWSGNSWSGNSWSGNSWSGAGWY